MRGRIRRASKVGSREQAEEVLSSVSYGHLGTVGVDGYPYVVPVHYVWMNGAVYFHSATEGHKLDNLRAEPRVCFEVEEHRGLVMADDPCEVGVRYRSVVIFGRAAEVMDPREKEAALRAIADRAGAPGELLPAKVRSCAVVRIDPEMITCKVGS